MWLLTGGVDTTNMAENGPLTHNLKSSKNSQVYKNLSKVFGGGGRGCKYESYFTRTLLHCVR